MSRGTVAERFWTKVDRRGPNECWPWTAGITSEGYGRFRTGGRDAPLTTASRMAYELTHGRILDLSIQVMHSCDNPPCCNPRHLSLGTGEDNARDCAAKNREKDQRGSKHALTRLTEADIVEMRAAYWVRGETLKTICARHGIVKGTASYIVNGHTWSHVPMPAEAMVKRANVTPSNTTTRETA